MITLLLGGARSGKSALAERLATATGEPVTFVATGRPLDEDMAERIRLHRVRRPATWATVEAGTDLAADITPISGTVLLDALGTWVAAAEGFDVDVGGLCRVLAARRETSIVVSDEVGLGVHPETDVGRKFRDALGGVNQEVAAIADEVQLVVAGRVIRLDSIG